MKRIIIVSLVTILFSSLAVGVVHAGPLTGALGNLNTAVGSGTDTGLSNDLPTTIGTIIKGVLALVGTIFFVLTIYAGILWMTAMGNSEVVDKSRSIITAAVIGLAITLSAYAITYFVGNRLGGATNGTTAGSGSTCNGICVQANAGCGVNGTLGVGTCQANYVCCGK